MQHHQPALEDSKPLQAGLVAGALGALLLFVIQTALQAGGIAGDPTGIAFARHWLGIEGAGVVAIGLLLFCLAGAAWGMVYVFAVRHISAATGAIFGLAPWLAVMMVLLPFMGRAPFAGGDPMGILSPLILNVVWGAFVGAIVPALPLARQEWVNDH